MTNKKKSSDGIAITSSPHSNISMIHSDLCANCGEQDDMCTCGKYQCVLCLGKNRDAKMRHYCQTTTSQSNKFQKPDFDFKNEFIKLKKKYNYLLLIKERIRESNDENIKEVNSLYDQTKIMEGQIKILKHALFAFSIVSIIFLLKLL